jgi:hypothetical protein
MRSGGGAKRLPDTRCVDLKNYLDGSTDLAAWEYPEFWVLVHLRTIALRRPQTRVRSLSSVTGNSLKQGICASRPVGLLSASDPSRAQNPQMHQNLGDLRLPNPAWRIGKAAKWFEARLDLPKGVIVFRNPDGSKARIDKSLKALRRDWDLEKRGA